MPDSISPYIAKPDPQAALVEPPESADNLGAMSAPLNDLDLHDIHLPEPISWWPPAAGWWWLLLLLFLVLAAAYFLNRYRRNKRSALKTLARKEFVRIQDQFQDDADQQALAKELSILLRRVCVSHFPRHDCAGLTGEAWLAFLDQNFSTGSHSFQQGIGRELIEAPYKKINEYDAAQLMSLCSDCLEGLK